MYSSIGAATWRHHHIIVFSYWEYNKSRTGCGETGIVDGHPEGGRTRTRRGQLYPVLFLDPLFQFSSCSRQKHNEFQTYTHSLCLSLNRLINVPVTACMAKSFHSHTCSTRTRAHIRTLTLNGKDCVATGEQDTYP